MVEAEPPPHEASVLAGRQRRGDEHRGRAVLPQPLAQLARDVDRRPGERVGLRPDDPLVLARLEARLDLRRQCRARAAPARRDPRPGPCSASRGRRARRRARAPARRAPPAAACARTPARRRAAAARPRARPGRAARAGCGFCASRQARSTSSASRRTPAPRDAAAEPRRGRLLEPVRLVEDDGVVLGQHAAAGGDVREVERVVRDHEVGLARAVARRLGEAGRDERAAAAGAAVAADGELGPERLRRLELQLGPVARLGLVEPALHRLPGAPRRAPSAIRNGWKPCSCRRQT